METLQNIVLVLHFIGLASLLGGFLVQMSAFKTRSAVINPAILHGALTQLVTGVLLVGIMTMRPEEVEELNYPKIATKLAVVVVIYVLALLNRKKTAVSMPIIGAIGALTILNIVLAVFW